MTAGREFELKFGVAASQAAAVAAALDSAGATRERLESRYFDTADGRLAVQQLALRLRRSRDGWEQTLKAPGPSLRDRYEDTRPAARPARADTPDIDPALHGGLRSGRELMRLLERGDSSPAPLVERYSTVVERLAVDVVAGASRIEVAFDRGQLLAGDASEPICEVEYELKSGGRELAFAVARLGIVEHGLWLQAPSKSQRGEQLALGKPLLARKAGRCRLDSRMGGSEIARAVLATAFEQIGANASAVAAGTPDDDLVHQLRIGLRRARTAARELGGLDEAVAGPWLDAATATFRRLGETRDRTVVAAALEARLAAAGSPLPALLPQGNDAARVDPVEVVRDHLFQLALIDLVEFVDATRPRGDGKHDEISPARARALIAGRLERLHRRVSRAAKRFDRLEEEAQHRIRKQLKRLRYLGEAVATLFPARSTRRFLARLSPAQDVLGAHVDLLTGRRWALALAAEAPGAAFNVAWFETQLEASATACRKALSKVAGARPFWR